MRYTRMRQWLSRMAKDERMSRDGRNPYGSRGGYVDSARGRDYEYDRMGDMAHNREYSSRDYNRDYNRADYEMDGRNNQYDRQHNRDYARRVGYFDYNDDYKYDMRAYDYNRGRDYNRDYNYDMRGRDYAEEDFKLTDSDIKKWEKAIRESGGSIFGKEQVEAVARQSGIKFDEFSPELLTVVASALKSDYGKTINGDVSLFIKLAKDFLCDDDFDGTPEEKAYLYYNAIVNKDDE